MDSAEQFLAKISSLAGLKKENSKDTENATRPGGIHLPFLVCLLESVGFQLRKVDCVDPKSMFRKSTTVLISCGLSGQRCLLDLPEETDDCDCLIKGSDASEFYLEAFSNGKSEQRWLAESSSEYCIPFVSNELKSLSGTVLHEIVTLMKKNFRDINHDPGEGLNNCDSGVPKINIPDIITSEEGKDVAENDTIGDHFEKREENGEDESIGNTDSNILGQTYIVKRTTTTKTITKKTTVSSLKRSISDSGPGKNKSLIPKQISSSISASDLKTCTSSDNKNLKVNQKTAKNKSPLRRSISDSSRKNLVSKQTISSTLRKCNSNSKVDSSKLLQTAKLINISKSTPNLKEKGDKEASKAMMPKLLQTARNIITKKSTPHLLGQAKKILNTKNVKSHEEDKVNNIEKLPHTKTGTSTPNYSSFATNPKKTLLENKKVGAVLRQK